MTKFLDYCYQLHDIFKKPVTLGEIDPRFNNLNRALKLLRYEKNAEPYKDLMSVKCWKFRLMKAECLKSGKDICETPIDNYGNIIHIRLCKRKASTEFQFLWTLRKSSIADLEEEGYLLSSNITDVELRTSDEKKALTDVVHAFYNELTRQKYAKACIPRKGDYIKYKNELHKVAKAYRADNKERIDSLINPFDIMIITDKKLKIQNSLDWEVQDFETKVTGEVRCTKCQIISEKQTLDLKMVRGHGFFCGPCWDYLYENNLI